MLDRQIEVMSKAGNVLNYDRAVSADGLTWSELKAWWAERQGLSLDEAHGSLWRRLVAAIPTESPPQRALFEMYYKVFGDRQPLPALLPEVWFHWDPVTKMRRGQDAAANQRMDFLMLLRDRRRVVIEVDGAQHYSSADGDPSPAVYAETTRSDRDLRLSGYEVSRFSGYELGTEGRARNTVTEFFTRLFDTQR